MLFSKKDKSFPKTSKSFPKRIGLAGPVSALTIKRLR